MDYLISRIGKFTKLHRSDTLLSFFLSRSISTRSSVGATSSNALDDKRPLRERTFGSAGET
ncbi:MAG: hypothetical protein SGI87_11875 [Flavobacteriales bacterium]|nr:hypothetical protein [Flavobacteriales bacterium]